MEILELIWIICFFLGMAMSLAGMLLVLLFWKQFEKACPAIFNLAEYPATGWRKSSQYWAYILGGNYEAVDRADIRLKCSILRIYFWLYLLIFAIAAIGIFVPWPKLLQN